MGRISGTAKKLQTVADTAETLYRRVEELRAEVNALRDGVQDTNEATARIEQELAGQRAVLRALAAEQGVDTEALMDEVMADETDTGATAEPAGNGAASSPSTAGTTDEQPAETTDTEAETTTNQRATADARTTASGSDDTTGA